MCLNGSKSRKIGVHGFKTEKLCGKKWDTMCLNGSNSGKIGVHGFKTEKVGLKNGVQCV